MYANVAKPPAYSCNKKHFQLNSTMSTGFSDPGPGLSVMLGLASFPGHAKDR